MLVLLRLVHTIIALVNFAALFYMIYAHWTGRRTPLLRWCYLAITLEAIAIIPFGLRCPITLAVDRWWPPGTPDILIPYWVSVRLIEWGGVLLAIALAPLAYRRVSRRRAPVSDR